MMTEHNFNMFDLKKLRNCVIFTFILGFAAYGYVFTNFTPAHDGIMTVTHDGGWQISLGRGLMPVYVYLFRGRMDVPWLIGILTLIYTSFASFLTADLLGVKDELWKIFAISVIYVLNISYVCSAAVYIYLLDVYALALLMSVASVYLFAKINNKRIALAVAAAFLSVSMGLYQSYFAVALSLFFILFIQDLLNGERKLKESMKIVLMEVGILAIASFIYMITLKVIQHLTHYTTVDNYNSVSNVGRLTVQSVLKSIPDCYGYFFSFFFLKQPYTGVAFTIINICLLIISVWAYISCLSNIKNSINRALLVIALILFPLGCNCIFLLSGGMVHYLMVFSFQTFYLLLILPIINGNFRKDDGLIKSLMVVFIVIISFLIIRFSNDIFYYQKLVGEGTEASITNILYDIERCEGFDESSMPITIVGSPNVALAQDYEMQDIFGSYPGIGGNGTTITYDLVFGAYLHYLLGRNYEFDYSEEVIKQIKTTSEYNDMSVYPKDGYMKVIDGYLVIRLE